MKIVFGKLQGLVSNTITYFQNPAHKPELFIAIFAFGLLCSAAFPAAAFAWDANAAAISLLDFLKTLIIVAAGAVAVTLIFRSQIVPAIVVIVASAFFYVILSPDLMKAIGEGLKGLINLS